jgi:hypothetical protein
MGQPAAGAGRHRRSLVAVGAVDWYSCALQTVRFEQVRSLVFVGPFAWNCVEVQVVKWRHVRSAVFVAGVDSN